MGFSRDPISLNKDYENILLLYMNLSYSRELKLKCHQNNSKKSNIKNVALFNNFIREISETGCKHTFFKKTKIT